MLTNCICAYKKKDCSLFCFSPQRCSFIITYIRSIRKHLPKQTGLICVINLVPAKLKLIKTIAKLILKWFNRIPKRDLNQITTWN